LRIEPSTKNERSWMLWRMFAVTVIGFVVAASCGQGALAPSATPETSATTPTPQQTQTVNTVRVWNELRWSSPAPIPDGGAIIDVVPWRAGYVAVGQASDGDRYVGAAFISQDGTTWARTSATGLFPVNPTRVVATSSSLMAFATVQDGNPSVMVWTSSDGQVWHVQPGLALAGSLVSVVAHADWVVAVGRETSGVTKVWRSADGVKWTSSAGPGPRAVVRGVASVADGLVAFGRDGAPDTVSGGVNVAGIGRPAAWWSLDGDRWASLNVEGAETAGAELGGMFALADGLFASGSNSPAGQSTRTLLLWTSPDGRDWRLIGVPAHWGQVGANGEYGVIFSPAGPTGFEAWATRDGSRWSLVAPAGDTARMPAYSTGVGQSSRIDRIFVVPRGVVVIGQRDGQVAAWFAEGAIR
jgi:hypothetical protein